MSYDPNFPPTNAEIISAQFRAQFQGLKALIDQLAQQIEPIGTIKAWDKNFPGVPPLGANWVECNGQVLVDAESPLNGQTMRDLNGASGPQMFLRGAMTSGGNGGSDTHSHDVDLSPGAGDFTAGSDAYAASSGHVNTAEVSSLPSYYEVVWVVRVK